MSVRLRTMTSEEYHKFQEMSIASEVQDRMHIERISYETAHKQVTEEFSRMLPDGLFTKDHNLLSVENSFDKRVVGFIWTLYEKYGNVRQCFICDFQIFEQERRKRYGSEVLHLMEQVALDAGCSESVLYVADHNHIAGNFYLKCGYHFLRKQDDGLYMVKTLC